MKTAGPGLPGPFLSRRYAAKAKTLVHVVARKLLTAKQVIVLLPRGDRSGHAAAMLFRSETVSYDVADFVVRPYRSIWGIGVGSKRRIMQPR